MKPDFAALLRAALSGMEMVIIRSCAQEAAAVSCALYMVGGIPRDLVLGRTGGDFDLVIEGDAISLARRLAAKYGGSVTAHHRFGTAKWHLRGSSFSRPAEAGKPSVGTFGGHLDLISARRETYGRPGELPSVRTGSIDDDLRRRDFTINTLALRLDDPYFGTVRDDFGALSDLEHHQIRVLHPQSFRDDPTRIYRAVRYEQRYRFLIADDTQKLIGPSKSLIAGLSAHRIRRELDLMLEEERAVAMLSRLMQLDLLKPIHPALPRDRAVLRRIAIGARTAPELGTLPARGELSWLLWLIELPPRRLQPLIHRLQFSATLARSLPAASELLRRLHRIESWKPSAAAAYLRTLPLLSIQAVYLAAPRGKARRQLLSYLTNWRHARPTVTGHDLKRKGITPGPIYERILAELRDRWIDGLVRTPQEEQASLEAILLKTGGDALRLARRRRPA